MASRGGGWVIVATLLGTLATAAAEEIDPLNPPLLPAGRCINCTFSLSDVASAIAEHYRVAAFERLFRAYADEPVQFSVIARVSAWGYELPRHSAYFEFASVRMGGVGSVLPPPPGIDHWVLRVRIPAKSIQGDLYDVAKAQPLYQRLASGDPQLRGWSVDRAIDEILKVAPAQDAVAASLRLDEYIADSRTCQGVVERLEALEAVKISAPDVPSVGTDEFDGWWGSYGVQVREDGYRRLTYNAGLESELAGWVDSIIPAVESCWTRVEPDSAP